MGAPPAEKKPFQFPTAVTTLALVSVVVWVAALFLPPGAFETDADGSPIPGTYRRIETSLSLGEAVRQLVLAPVNGVYGLKSPETDTVDTTALGRMFGQIGVIVFIMSIGAFISVSFATRSLEVAVGRLAHRLKDQGWMLIASVMVLFSLLGSTMGFSVETLGFYALFLPLMAALGYDRLVTASMIILGALVGVMASTVNPFSIGVAAGEAGVSIGDGIGLRLLLWVVLTAMAVAWVLRYAAAVRRDPSASLVGWDPEGGAEEPAATSAEGAEALTTQQIWVLAITAFAFGLMIFSVIPWSSIVAGGTGPADYMLEHETSVAPFWFELGWWFPQLAMLFIAASVLVGLIAGMGEKETVRLISAGAADMMGPSLVILLAGGISVILNNTQTLDTILHAMEQLVRGASAGVFAFITVVINVPLAILIPSSSGHAALAMPLLSPLADFANVARATTITAWILAHGLALLVSPTSVVLVGGLAIAKVRLDQYLRFVWPLILAFFLVAVGVVGFAATIP
ncbi:hypothetical protein MYXO_02236 [Myxococcaceae bacterium]|nr:hypothetical protein MYXO_02236 [Myxococcaceae bacterium]